MLMTMSHHMEQVLRLCIRSGLFVCIGGVVAFGQKPTASGGENLTGRFAGTPYEVAVLEEVVLRDEGRGKALPVKVRYPVAAGRFPVIVFSHGAGESKDAAPELSRHWCSHGYVCVHPTHAVSKPPRRRHSVTRVFREFNRREQEGAESWADRTQDLSFVIDSLPLLEKQAPVLQDKIDVHSVGIAGHSFGAYTVMLVAGATLAPQNGGETVSYKDPRPRAVLILSGPGRDEFGLAEHSWDAISIPMMVMAGSRDPGLKWGQGPMWRAEPYTFAPAGEKHLVYLRGANHVSYIGSVLATENRRTQQNRAGRVRRVKQHMARWAPAIDQRALLEYVQIASTAFWDAYLKQDVSARAYLTSDVLEVYTQGIVSLQHK